MRSQVPKKATQPLSSCVLSSPAKALRGKRGASAGAQQVIPRLLAPPAPTPAPQHPSTWAAAHTPTAGPRSPQRACHGMDSPSQALSSSLNPLNKRRPLPQRRDSSRAAGLVRLGGHPAEGQGWIPARHQQPNPSTLHSTLSLGKPLGQRRCSTRQELVCILIRPTAMACRPMLPSCAAPIWRPLNFKELSTNQPPLGMSRAIPPVHRL